MYTSIHQGKFDEMRRSEQHASSLLLFCCVVRCSLRSHGQPTRRAASHETQSPSQSEPGTAGTRASKPDTAPCSVACIPLSPSPTPTKNAHPPLGGDLVAGLSIPVVVVVWRDGSGALQQDDAVGGWARGKMGSSFRSAVHRRDGCMHAGED